MVEVVLAASLVGLVASTVYLALAVVAAFRFVLHRRQLVRISADRRQPPVSVLKPVYGSEPGLEECLESFFAQKYDDFELIFGARTSVDPALHVVANLQTRYPAVKTRIVVTGEPRYANAKVAALEQMIDAAPAPLLVIADSDVRIDSDCLASLVPPLLDPRNGLVTCLYRGASAGGWWSALEALGMSVEMTSGVLVADMLEGMRFALGPTMATRKDVVETIGGISALGAYCADDYVLGQRVHAAGYRVVLSHRVIDHLAVNRSLRESWNHQLRWMRSTRFSRPAGHVGTGLTFAVPYGVLGAAAALAGGRPKLALALLAWALVNRWVLCVAAGWAVVRDPAALTRGIFYPVRDLLGFAVWCCSFFGSSVVWRGQRYALGADGRMLAPDAAVSPAAVDRPRREVV